MGAAVHPFYMSVTEMEVDRKAKKVKVSCKLFLDDIQNELAQTTGEKVDLTTTQVKNTKLLETYIQQHLFISFGKTRIPLTAIGYELEEEAVWCYLEGPFPPGAKKVTVRTDLLCNSFPSQMNIVHWLVDNKRISNRLNCEKQAVSIDF